MGHTSIFLGLLYYFSYSSCLKVSDLVDVSLLLHMPSAHHPAHVQECLHWSGGLPLQVQDRQGDDLGLGSGAVPQGGTSLFQG